MYAIQNTNGLLLMQVGINDYSFTDNVEQASKFFSEQNAQLKIRKLPMLTGLKVIQVK